MKQNWGYRDSSPQRMFTALVEDLSFFFPQNPPCVVHNHL